MEQDERPGVAQDGPETEPASNDVSTPEVASAEEPAPAVMSTPDPQSPKKKLHLGKKQLVILGATVAVMAGAALWYFVLRKDPQITPAPAQNSEVDETDDYVIEDQIKETPVDAKTLAATWLGTPKEATNVELFSTEALEKYFESGYEPVNREDLSKSVAYRELGTSAGARIMSATLYTEGLGVSSQSLVFLDKPGDEPFVVLEQHSDFFGDDGAYGGPGLPADVKFSDKEQLEGFVLQDDIEVKGAKLHRTTTWFFDDEFDPWGSVDPGEYTEVEKNDYGVVSERIVGDGEDGVKSYYLLLKQPAGTYVQYRYVLNELKDDYSLAVSWNDGSSTTDKFRWDEAKGGCGFGYGVNVVAKQFHKDLVKRGKAGDKDVYEFSSASHALVKKVYDAYASSNDKAVSQEEYYKNHGVVVVKNELSYYVLLANTKYVSGGECAKPVIYLYPQAPTVLHVSVEADVTKSDPIYKNGWSVMAFPGGSLIHEGKTYRSLFWDGLGHGQYPEITSGFMVKRENVEPTIRRHLTTFGLNQVEIQDFIDYWMPLMPDSPYVRLTWFDTPMMEQLAPLHLSVSPDTLIRVFLDFEGYDTPVNIPTQRLYSTERRGFTAVEWGGLKTYR